MFRKAGSAGLILILLPVLVRARDFLFYLEAQAVLGYSSELKKFIYYSISQEDAMQKPSLGFDYLQRFSGETRDFGVFALQVRLAYNEGGSPKIEPQVYNAYFKYKAGFADLWIGHSRPAFGISSYLDGHSLLLPTLAMMGYGFDRDWGLGLSRDLAGGDVSASFTSGSGMPLHFRGNALAAVRISRGVLNRDNTNIGFSLASGRVLDSMGYHLMSPDPVGFHMAALDFCHLWKNFENRIEIMAGKKAGQNSLLFFWRLGTNWLEENRLKAEIQPIWMKRGPVSEWQLSGGVSFQVSADLALRSLYQYLPRTGDHRIILQIYFYKGM